MPTAARLARLSKSLSQFDKTVVKTAGDVVAKGLLDQVARDTGGDRRMSGFGKRGGALGVEVRVVGKADVRIVPTAGQAGQWAILNGGARPHDVVASGARGGRRGSGARALNLGGGRFATRVHNVRSPAKRTWQIARDQSIPKVVDAARAEFRKVVRS